MYKSGLKVTCDTWLYTSKSTEATGIPRALAVAAAYSTWLAGTMGSADEYENSLGTAASCWMRRLKLTSSGCQRPTSEMATNSYTRRNGRHDSANAMSDDAYSGSFVGVESRTIAGTV
ncbi:hypothetical protein, variant 2 [Aphanomyces astaci]|uniref:Uncharacterized protein n=1 Tax=Aphanomyces astaci TaxID=112090 RepID=W4FMG7_APHAT|nr:hypothetical protein, variant 2 [Aphanomyces astaci]ETV67893.1 hypothetical protein, variant 2 [Aphanomyces astaci]|eukprot:XP_009842637.1 hypothetical protein, variant 2 [Aphanomyces astaci]